MDDLVFSSQLNFDERKELRRMGERYGLAEKVMVQPAPSGRVGHHASFFSVADPGCLFRIRVFSIPGSGSETLEIFFDLSAAVLFILSCQLIFNCFLCAGAEQCGRHQGYHQEEPGQESEPPRQGDQNFKGEHLA
jgi:hypothetical protein